MEANLLNHRNILSRMWSPGNLSTCLACISYSYCFLKDPLTNLLEDIKKMKELSTSPPSSKTNTSPCSKGDIVPASVFKYGSEWRRKIEQKIQEIVSMNSNVKHSKEVEKVATAPDPN
jgi:hypothetical protein